MKSSTPWIYSPKFDLSAIIGPPIMVTIVVLMFGNRMVGIKETPVWLWVLLVLCIDVAHVYSSLFRTYFDKEEFAKRRVLYALAPIASWGVGVAIYLAWGPVAFWSFVAYFAIYHFVRQQYGFMMLYRRGEPASGMSCRIDQVAIYASTLYPMLYWHTYSRDFEWFSNFQMPTIPVVWPEQAGRVLYVAILMAFVIKELRTAVVSKKVNTGKVLLLASTAAAWATGIIAFNGDITFAVINIVSHGVPYMALVWIYQSKKRVKDPHRQNPFLRFFQVKYVPLYCLALFLLAYVEEGAWDLFVWKEHPNLFGPANIPVSGTLLALLIPLLTMPQVTHYVLDAFIWRVNKKGGTEVRAVIG